MTALFNVIVNGLVVGGMYALIAMGLNLQYGFARILNLAYGEFLMLGAFITYVAFTAAGLNPIISLSLTLPTSFALSWLVYVVALKSLVHRARSPGQLDSDTILVTFGLSFILQNAALLQWGGQSRGYTYMAEAVTVLGTRLAANRVLAFAVAVLVALAAYVLIRHTRLGTAFRALAIDPVAANLVAIDVRLYSMLAFAVGGAMVGAAGTLLSSFLTISPAMGVAFTMKALIVVILGGIGNMLGSLAAGLILGVAESLGSYLVDPGLTLAINYTIFAAILLLRPQGLFARG